MTRSGAFKLCILLFVTFILCLPEFFPNVSQIEFHCEPFNPCTPENNAQACGLSAHPCATETIDASQHRQEGWYLCESQMDLRLLRNNTSQSGEHVMAILTMKTANLSEWNYSVFAFLNNTDLYTEAQNEHTLFYCNLPPDNSKCPDVSISLQDNISPSQQNNSILTTSASAKPIASSLDTTTLSFEVKCQETSSSFLFYYHEHNVTTRSAELPDAETKRVWLALVLTVVVVTILTVGILIIKSILNYQRKSRMARSASLLARGQRNQNLINNLPDVSIAISSMNADDEVSSEISSMENRKRVNLLKVADLMHKRSLSPIYEITETSLDDRDQSENQENSECNASATKEEYLLNHICHLPAQDQCETSTYLHHRSNFAYSSLEDGEL